jgi:hypothetical protein
MANEEHLKILKQGVEAWNRWRKENPDTAPDLSGAYLGDADLSGANLSKANITLANLSRANLSEADLSDTDLSETRLNRAFLGGTYFTRANLVGADLSGAYLYDTKFIRADLTRVDFTGANLSEALFVDVYLSYARGLETCAHLGPTDIDFTTLRRSDMLPIQFLRGCGLPDSLIDFLPTLISKDYYSCFISYSTDDQEFADRLYGDLQSKGVRCWYAPHHMRSGKKMHDQIKKAIGEQDRVLLILSQHSMNSEWVKTEIADARAREVSEGRQMLFPIRLVDMETIKKWQCFDADTSKDSAREIREYFIPDFQNWKDSKAYKASFDRLLNDLKAPATS